VARWLLRACMLPLPGARRAPALSAPESSRSAHGSGHRLLREPHGGRGWRGHSHAPLLVSYGAPHMKSARAHTKWHERSWLLAG
jgi:hypothetical protein